MKVNLLTDAPRHNLALMKISTYHKKQGDEVALNQPLRPTDVSYGSWLFTSSLKYNCDLEGGPAISPYNRSPCEMERPDYDLFPNMDYSLGYTWSYCPRRCKFCVVPKQRNPRVHHSIWEFHEPRFRKICLLNNNTFSDPQWRETFEEIWDAGLTVIDENGYDLRLVDHEQAEALKQTNFYTGIHFAWDRITDEPKIIRGLKLLKEYHLRSVNNLVYVLIGFDTTMEEDLHRCQVINDHGLTPYPMLYSRTEYTRSFRRFINLHYYRTYKTITDAWKDYKYRKEQEPSE